MSRASDERCIFCRIVRRAAPAEIVAETGDLLAFHDVNPQAPHHVLIIPKAHIASPNDLAPSDADLVGRMILMAHEIAEDRDLGDAGYRLVLNCGRQAGQSVFHMHFHLLGGRFFSWPPG